MSRRQPDRAFSADRVLRILREAGAADEELGEVKRVLELWAEGRLTSDDVYYYIMGFCRERFIPLTPRQVGDLREALGLPRGAE